MTDPTHDTLTVCTDPELTVTRAGDSDAVHIVASSEAVTVPPHAVATLVTALEAMDATPTGAGYTGRGGGGVDITKVESADTGGGGGGRFADDDARECPECDGQMVDALGGPRCDACGFEPEGDDA